MTFGRDIKHGYVFSHFNQYSIRLPDIDNLGSISKWGQETSRARISKEVSGAPFLGKGFLNVVLPIPSFGIQSSEIVVQDWLFRNSSRK